jgi:hypothetical protein
VTRKGKKRKERNMRRTFALTLAVVGVLVLATGISAAAHSKTARERTWIYKPSGARLGLYGLNPDRCDHAEFWWASQKVGKVMISGSPSYSYAYARRISRDYWRLAEISVDPIHLGTVKREGNRWVLRNKTGRIIIYTSGPDAVEAALAWVSFGRECTLGNW